MREFESECDVNAATMYDLHCVPADLPHSFSPRPSFVIDVDSRAH